jgi:hypothetical protein
MRKTVAAIAIASAFATSAQARTHHHHHRQHAHHYRHSSHHHDRQHADGYGYLSSAPAFGYSSYGPSPYERLSRRHGRSGGRPAAWCGWYMRQQVGADPGPAYNLARAWAHYGVNAGGPSVGTIVVWRHHVGKIVGHENGQWLVQSGNDGHAVRTRPRSLAGVIAFRRAFAAM